MSHSFDYEAERIEKETEFLERAIGDAEQRRDRGLPCDLEPIELARRALSLATSLVDASDGAERELCDTEDERDEARNARARAEGRLERIAEAVKKHEPEGAIGAIRLVLQGLDA